MLYLDSYGMANLFLYQMLFYVESATRLEQKFFFAKQKVKKLTFVV
jgi:hypothetical protein